MGLAYKARTMLSRAGIETRMLFREIGIRNGVEIRWRDDRSDNIRGSIAKVNDSGIEYLFFVANDSDTVQREALSGSLYERDELAIIERYFGGGTYVDVGTNIGNHALFAVRSLKADRVICFEPNPEALRILDINLRLNDCVDKVVVHAVGLSDEPGRGTLSGFRNNLGSARFALSTDGGGFPIRVGDAVFADEKVDFIKIDTEGFELKVLKGLEATIDRDKPTIFIEVDDKNLEQFQATLVALNYSIATTIRNYSDNQNIVITPR